MSLILLVKVSNLTAVLGKNVQGTSWGEDSSAPVSLVSFRNCPTDRALIRLKTYLRQDSNLLWHKIFSRVMCLRSLEDSALRSVSWEWASGLIGIAEE